ncbi:SDR family NAD(P)-dependent oxidoreductase [Chromobacterium sp. IIBBL 290-4]|uniref:SDR family NAD(P)-dependent oxidoreductase n=1 Tax=Chromobacterium sp. IIBBL 290-4 TaxID=2953890 RepID=UPI0020B881A6|nr:SDR family oxidoreductase [Chromobacterium sp. IIBBL 290-4]UTH76452.1 SDR family oxidoreductase [Chromobacterium sp. IIBBL 290-4]
MNTEALASYSDQDKGVIIVSGGSQGLGCAIVERLLQSGYRVATFSRRCTATVERLVDLRGFFWQSVDCTNYASLKRFIDETEQRLGRLSGLVNNAAMGVDGILATMPLSDIDRALDINLKGQIYLTKLAAGKMLKGRDGAIVNISSINAVRGHSGLAVYSATKAALDGMTRSLAKELGPKGIRVNSVSPGYFASDMVKTLSEDTLRRIQRRTPLGRLGTQKEIAELVLFLIRDGSFITGQNITIDGGFTC